MNFDDVADNLKNSVGYAVRGKAGLLSLLVGAVFLVLMIVMSRPAYSMQAIGYGIQYLPVTVYDLFWYNTDGNIMRALMIFYSAAAGIAVTNVVAQIKYGKSAGGGLTSVGPGMIVSGCAGCGAGLLGFFGLGGALALLPFHGVEFLVFGILLIGVFLVRTGDPRVCNLKS